jgi:hypothetical protein
MAATDDKYEHIYQHGGIVTVLKSHGLSAVQQHSQLCPSAPSSRATLAEKAAIVAKTKRDADAAAATTKAVAAVINTDAAAAVTIAAALVSAARATARGAAAREVATARRPAAKRAAAKAAEAAAAKPTEAAAAVPTAPTAEAVVPAAPLTPSRNSSSGVGSSGAPSAEPDSLRLRRLNMSSGDGSEGAPSAEPSAAPLEMSAFVSRKLVVRACSFERKVGQQRRGDDSGMLRRTLSFDKVQRGADKLQRRASFGRKNSRSSGRGEGGQTGALRLEPPVRHGPCYSLVVVHLCFIPISCSWRAALPPHEPSHTTQPPRHRSRRF